MFGLKLARMWRTASTKIKINMVLCLFFAMVSVLCSAIIAYKIIV